MAQKKFKKTLWLQTANEQVEAHILSPREVNDALEIWVNALDGKTEEELTAMGVEVRSEWLAFDEET